MSAEPKKAPCGDMRKTADGSWRVTLGMQFLADSRCNIATWLQHATVLQGNLQRNMGGYIPMLHVAACMMLFAD